MKKIFATSLRGIIGLTAAVWLISHVISNSGVDIVTEFKQSNRLPLTLAIGLFGLVLIICVYRWKLLLNVQGIHLHFFRLVQLSMIGVFFNLVIPGAVSGDFIKMAYISPHAKGKTTEAVLTIFLDRILGLFGLFLVALVFVLFSFKFLLMAEKRIQLGALVVGLGSISSILGLLAVEYRRGLQRIPGVTGILRVSKKVIPIKIHNILTRFILALEIYREHKLVVAKAISLSVIVHLCLALTILCIGRGFHENTVQASHFFLSTQVANAVGAIPLTPAGIGSRDFALKLFLESGGADSAKAGIIPVFYTIVLSFWSLIGGIFYIFINRK